jgi:hypothetical protein
MNKKISRQRRWQIKQRENGNCQICGKPSPLKSNCDLCAKVKKGGSLKKNWIGIDWSKSDQEIAKEMKVSRTTVWRRRKSLINTDAAQQ